MKYLLFLLTSLLCLCSTVKAQEPVIAMTTSKVVGATFKFFVGTSNTGSSIKVDFGDGVLVDKIVGTGDTVKGNIGASKVVKIYGTGINSFACANMRLSALDVTKCSTLVKLWCNDNILTSLDVTKCTLLTSFRCYRNLITSLDVTQCKALTEFHVGVNQITSLDVSKCTSLKLLGCHDLLLTELDITNCPLTYLVCYNNKLNFASLPLKTVAMTIYDYAGQLAMTIPTNHSSGAVNLSSQAIINGNATTYVWKTESGATLVNGSDYSITGGITTFLKKQTEKVYCEMTNATFPAFTSSLPLKTTLTSVSVNGAPAINNQTFAVTEASPNGTLVGKVLASDADADALTYSIISGNTSDAFEINATTGEITVKTSTALNYESLATYALTVKVQDNGVGSLSASATISISLTDKNESPVINNQLFSVVEASPNETLVGKVLASDPDADALTYLITSGNTSDAFAINASTGEITVKTSTALNYESLATYALTIKAQDNGVGSLSASAIITINLTDKNEAPVINNQIFSVVEASPNGTLVGKVLASDPDANALTYSITSGNTSDAFAINASTGEINVNTSTDLNYESLSTYSLTVKVQDNGALSSTAAITINLTDKNEAPVIHNQTFSIKESTTTGTVVGTVLASDPDGDILTYSIVSGNISDAFAINAGTGAITVKTSSALNCELLPSYALTVKVQDNGVGVLSNSTTVTINLTDKNQTPLISNQTFTIKEKLSNGALVGKVLASDPDAGTLTYSIISGNTSDAFAINVATGEITVKTSSVLNYAALPTYDLTVKVQDNGVGTLSNSATITINLSAPTKINSLETNKTNYVYPNPSHGLINIDPDLFIKGQVQIKIFDLNGKLVMEKKDISDNDSVEINTSGLFLIVLGVNNETFSQKIIVQK